jgi:acyl carrier protein
MAQVLDLPLASVPDDARIGAIEAWDSLGHLRIMLAIETEIGRELDASEVVTIESLADIAKVLSPPG